ncbi:MAG: putative dsRNA-binding protein, partial [Minisyncoccia bacterium]
MQVAEVSMSPEIIARYILPKARPVYSFVSGRIRSYTDRTLDHDKKFVVAAYLGRDKIAAGEGKSKQEAEQDAA